MGMEVAEVDRAWIEAEMAKGKFEAQDDMKVLVDQLIALKWDGAAIADNQEESKDAAEEPNLLEMFEEITELVELSR